MVRGKSFCRSYKQCKIRPINPIALLIFFSKCVCHLVGSFPSPLFCSHPHLYETRVTSLKLFCFRYFHFSLREFLISSLYILHVSTSLIPFIESSFQSCFNCSGDFHILLFQWNKQKNAPFLCYCTINVEFTAMLWSKMLFTVCFSQKGEYNIKQ